MKIVSLFCGCGGMDLGLIKSGHKVIWVNDIDEDSIRTYQNYFVKKFKLNKKHIVLEDIKNLTLDQVPDCDVVVGGFPCQGFSIANLFRNKMRKTEKQNNLLYTQLLRVIKGKMPKYFIAENVEGITSLGGYESLEKKKKKEGRVMTKIIKEMSNIGYQVKWKILNASDFGVPQERKRVIFIGSRNDLEVKKRLTHPLPTHSSKNDIYLKSTPTLWDAISDLEYISSKTNISNHTGTKHKVKINGYIGNRITKKHATSPTIVGRGGGTGGPVIIPHPNKKRRLTVRETARLQCFPDDMVFYGSNSSCYRQIGNAVPWLVAYNIGLNLKKL